MIKQVHKHLLRSINTFYFNRKTNKKNKNIEYSTTNSFGTKTPEDVSNKQKITNKNNSQEYNQNTKNIEEIRIEEEENIRENLAKMQGKLFRSIEDELEYEMKNPVQFDGK